MQFETTLKKLRDADACYGNYAYLTVMLDGGTREDAEKLKSDYRFLRRYRDCGYGDDIPISLQVVYDHNGYRDALWAVDSGACGQDAKKLAIGHALQCIGPILYLMTDKRSLNAVTVMMRYLIGDATNDEFSVAKSTAKSAAWDITNNAARVVARAVAWDATKNFARAVRAAARAAAWNSSSMVADNAARAVAWAVAWDATKNFARARVSSSYFCAAESEQDKMFCDLFGLELEACESALDALVPDSLISKNNLRPDDHADIAGHKLRDAVRKAKGVK